MTENDNTMFEVWVVEIGYMNGKKHEVRFEKKESAEDFYEKVLKSIVVKYATKTRHEIKNEKGVD